MTDILTAEREGTDSAARPGSRGVTITLARLRDFALVPPIIAIVVVGSILYPAFRTQATFTDLLSTMAWIALLVVAESLILISGKMDLSLESTVGLAPGVAAWLTLPTGINHGLHLVPGFFAVPIALAVGAVIGAINGFLIVRLRINAFIVTLGMLITLRGVLTGISHGQTFFGLTGSMMYLGSASWLGLPASIWVVLITFAIGIFVLAKTRVGRSLYAIGGNVDAARAAGIRTDRVVWTVLIIGGLLAALAGIVEAGNLASVTSNLGSGRIFDVFAAAVIGGVSLNGGKGSLFGAFTGVLLLNLIFKVLTFAGVPDQWFDFLNGAVILIVLIGQRIVGGRTDT
ncbi:MAG: simple sugar transport system permease protein [Pseudonocardiales bacterium]|jgi:simple sugar transport system permease protein|nr:simple sugar transport system permease protein [Pseudonocardiales bacterium]